MMPFSMVPDDARDPADVRFEDVHVEVLPDRQRVRVYVDLTPFKERPNLDFTIVDALENELATVDVVESMNWKMVFTMHLRGGIGTPPLTLRARLLAKEEQPDAPPDVIDRTEVSFEP